MMDLLGGFNGFALYKIISSFVKSVKSSSENLSTSMDLIGKSIIFSTKTLTKEKFRNDFKIKGSIRR